jgi:hypothetical protein
VLEFARGRPIEVGSNLPGQAGSAAWLLALPRAEPRRVACLGRPPAATLDALSGLGAEVAMIDERPTAVAEGRPPDGWADLLWVDADLPRLDRSRPYLALLAADGVLVVDTLQAGTGVGSLPIGRRDDGPPVLPAVRLTATPHSGAARSLVPAGDTLTRRFLSSRGLVASPRLPLIKHAGRGIERRAQALVRGSPLAGLAERAVLLAGAEVDAERPPRWLRALAATAGVHLDQHRWALSATGRYPTQKALLLLFPDGSDEPDVVVKASRFPAADRLVENEARVLRGLGALSATGEPRWPTVMFDGRAAGRALVAERALAGRPFADRSTRRPDCPVAADAIEGLGRLAEATADDVAGSAAAEALSDVVRRFAALYPASAPRADWIVDRLRFVAELPLRAVAIHGDPGPQNLLVDDRGTVAFVDWENGEPSGPPCWDIFHFTRSFATWSSRQRHAGTWLGASVAHLADGTAMTPTIIDAVERYRRRIGVAPAWLAPLFFAQLAYLAVNEATRLPADRLAAGGYARLLDRLHERRDGAVLRRLLAVDEAADVGAAGTRSER